MVSKPDIPLLIFLFLKNFEKSFHYYNHWSLAFPIRHFLLPFHVAGYLNYWASLLTDCVTIIHWIGNNNEDTLQGAVGSCLLRYWKETLALYLALLLICPAILIIASLFPFPQLMHFRMQPVSLQVSAAALWGTDLPILKKNSKEQVDAEDVGNSIRAKTSCTFKICKHFQLFHSETSILWLFSNVPSANPDVN